MVSTKKSRCRGCCCGLCSFKPLIFLSLVMAYIAAQALQEAPDFSDIDPSIRPFRPLPLLMLNYVLSTYLPSLIPSLEAKDILAGAELATGLSDWDDEDGSFHKSVEQISKGLKNGRDFTPFGAVWARMNLHVTFANRLSIHEYRKKHAEVAKQEIIEPVFITGTPRSGTTFIHNLIKLDTERFRAPLQWEIVDPVPPTSPDDDSLWTKLRLLISELGVSVFYLIAPEFAKVHPTSAMNAEECMPIMALDGKSLIVNTMFDGEDYNEWLHALPSSQLSSSFRIHKRFLQHLQSATTSEGKAPRQWLLKAPWHSNHLDEIFRTYPDAKVISTHRPPSGVIASLSSLHALLYGIVTDDLRTADIGRYQWRLWSKILPKYLAVREEFKNKTEDCVDLNFKALRKDPIQAVKEIYSQFGWEVSEAFEERMKDYIANSILSKGKFGKHEYKLEWFGLSEKDMIETPAFADYCERFGLEQQFKHSQDV